MRRPLENSKATGKPCPHCGLRNTQAQAWTEDGPFRCRGCGKVMRYWHGKGGKWGWNSDDPPGDEGT